MKRKVLSVMLCAAMVVSMTACGGSKPAETTAAATRHAVIVPPETTEAHQAIGLQTLFRN